jgi:hypothetical protein
MRRTSIKTARGKFVVCYRAVTMMLMILGAPLAAALWGVEAFAGCALAGGCLATVAPSDEIYDSDRESA